MTLFAFDAGQGLTKHTSPFAALVIVLEGVLTLTILTRDHSGAMVDGNFTQTAHGFAFMKALRNRANEESRS